MTISFKDISTGTYNACIYDIQEIYSKSDFYLRFIFNLADSKFIDHSFSATLKVSGSKTSPFYRWITTLIGHETDLLDTDSLIGKKCHISIMKIHDHLFLAYPASTLS